MKVAALKAIWTGFGQNGGRNHARGGPPIESHQPSSSEVALNPIQPQLTSGAARQGWYDG